MVRAAFLLILAGLPFFGVLDVALGQGMEASAMGGLGIADGDDQTRSFASAGGASIGWFFAGKHGLKFDYILANIRRDEFKRHFVTGSYIIQASSGANRPFFEVGAGLVREYRKNPFDAPAGARNSIGAILGGGITADFGRSFFIRPQVRTYWYAGPTLAVLPNISLGFRF